MCSRLDLSSPLWGLIVIEMGSSREVNEGHGWLTPRKSIPRLTLSIGTWMLVPGLELTAAQPLWIGMLTILREGQIVKGFGNRCYDTLL